MKNIEERGRHKKITNSWLGEEKTEKGPTNSDVNEKFFISTIIVCVIHLEKGDYSIVVENLQSYV